MENQNTLGTVYKIEHIDSSVFCCLVCNTVWSLKEYKYRKILRQIEQYLEEDIYDVWRTEECFFRQFKYAAKKITPYASVIL